MRLRVCLRKWPSLFDFNPCMRKVRVCLSRRNKRRLQMWEIRILLPIRFPQEIHLAKKGYCASDMNQKPTRGGVSGRTYGS